MSSVHLSNYVLGVLFLMDFGFRLSVHVLHLYILAAVQLAAILQDFRRLQVLLLC